MKLDEPKKDILTLNFNSNDIPNTSGANSTKIP
jgi:hypothetical protein